MPFFSSAVDPWTLKVRLLVQCVLLIALLIGYIICDSFVRRFIMEECHGPFKIEILIYVVSAPCILIGIGASFRIKSLTKLRFRGFCGLVFLAGANLFGIVSRAVNCQDRGITAALGLESILSAAGWFLLDQIMRGRIVMLQAQPKSCRSFNVFQMLVWYFHLFCLLNIFLAGACALLFQSTRIVFFIYLMASLFLWSSMVFNLSAIPTFLQSLRALRKASFTHWAKSKKRELKDLRHVALRQVLVVAAAGFGYVGGCVGLLMIMFMRSNGRAQPVARYVFTFFSVLSAVILMVRTQVLSGHLCQGRAAERAANTHEWERGKKWRRNAAAYGRDSDSGWQSKVEELADRGFTLGKLLEFYSNLPTLMVHFDPTQHKTQDVVRAAIIPDTRDQQCAYADKMMNKAPTRPRCMVTHNWGNLFRDLVAAIIADAMEEPTYGWIGQTLDEYGIPGILPLLTPGAASKTYWVCAFSVNQHASICGRNPYDVDPVTGLLHKVCTCGATKHFNNSSPLRGGDGKSIMCEMNKFDDVIALLSSSDALFKQVVAVDRQNELFQRAWCVSEIARSHTMGMVQLLKLTSKHSLDDDAHLKKLRIQDMQASRPEDVEEILSAIPDHNEFNQHLKHLLFGDAGLLDMWRWSDEGKMVQKLAEYAERARKLEAHHSRLAPCLLEGPSLRKAEQVVVLAVPAVAADSVMLSRTTEVEQLGSTKFSL